MNLLYLVFGNQPEIHAQANFSILTFLQQKEQLEYIIVLTDSPSYYNHIKDERLKIEIIDDAQLTAWKGPYSFFWRIKIKAIEYIANLYQEHSLLYVDADTFLFRDLSALKTLLESGNNVMHINEGKLSEMKSKTTSKMWKQIRGKSFANITMSKDDCMWNAGAVGISKSKFKDTIPLALELCDTMCEAKVTDRLIEQFALSVALNKTADLNAADTNIGHYWGNKKEWNQLIQNFFLSSHLKELSYEMQLSELQKLDFTTLPIFVKTPNTRERLINFVTRLFSDKHKTYIK